MLRTKFLTVIVVVLSENFISYIIVQRCCQYVLRNFSNESLKCQHIRKEYRRRRTCSGKCFYTLAISVVRDFFCPSVGSFSLPFFKSAVMQCTRNHPSAWNTNCSSIVCTIWTDRSNLVKGNTLIHEFLTRPCSDIRNQRPQNEIPICFRRFR